MGKNLVTKRFKYDSDWSVPPGVTKIAVKVFRELRVGQMASSSDSSNGNAQGLITQNGDLYMWGSGSRGQLGDATVVTKSNPFLLPTKKKWKMIAGGSNQHFAAIDEFGDLYTWGRNDKGQLGDGTIVDKSTPTLVVNGNRKWVQVSAGDRSTAGITDRGELYVWGTNTSGELGDGTTIAKSTPVAISFGGTFRQVQLYSGFSVALRQDDNVALSWGYDFFGGLGAGTTIERSTPNLVSGSTEFYRLYGIGNGPMALDVDGNAWGWGENSGGRIGNNSTANTSSPVQTVGGYKFVALATTAQNGAAAGITKDGQLYWWGDGNVNGSLGSNSVSSPTLVSGNRRYVTLCGTKAGVIFAGGDDGILYGWGYDDSGNYTLGNGTSFNYSSPTIVASGYIGKILSHELVRETTIDVVPGTSYSLKLWNNTILLYDAALEQNINLGARVDMPLIQLEYFA